MLTTRVWVDSLTVQATVRQLNSRLKAVIVDDWCTYCHYFFFLCTKITNTVICTQRGKRYYGWSTFEICYCVYWQLSFVFYSSHINKITLNRSLLLLSFLAIDWNLFTRILFKAWKKMWTTVHEARDVVLSMDLAKYWLFIHNSFESVNIVNIFVHSYMNKKVFIIKSPDGLSLSKNSRQKYEKFF